MAWITGYPWDRENAEASLVYLETRVSAADTGSREGVKRKTLEFVGFVMESLYG